MRKSILANLEKYKYPNFCQNERVIVKEYKTSNNDIFRRIIDADLNNFVITAGESEMNLLSVKLKEM